MRREANMQDLVPWLDDLTIQHLLGLAVYPDPVRLRQVCDRYRREPRCTLLGYQQDGIVVGCIGLELGENRCAIIHHIAVLPAVQRRGVGHAMLYAAQRLHHLLRLEAETHKDAVGFYKRCGFTVTGTGERFPGIERFRCVWQVGTE